MENYKEILVLVEKMEVDDEEDEERKIIIRMCKIGVFKFINLYMYYSVCFIVLYVC